MSKIQMHSVSHTGCEKDLRGRGVNLRKQQTQVVSNKLTSINRPVPEETGLTVQLHNRLIAKKYF